MINKKFFRPGFYLICIYLVIIMAGCGGSGGNSGNAYVADDDSGIQVIDISDPEDPVIIGSLDAPGWVNDVSVSGGYLYAASDSTGVTIYKAIPGN